MNITSHDIANLELELIRNIDRLCDNEKVAKQASRMVAVKLQFLRKALAEKELYERMTRNAY